MLFAKAQTFLQRPAQTQGKFVHADHDADSNPNRSRPAARQTDTRALHSPSHRSCKVPDKQGDPLTFWEGPAGWVLPAVATPTSPGQEGLPEVSEPSAVSGPIFYQNKLTALISES